MRAERPHSIGEEIANAVTHGIGLVASRIGVPALLVVVVSRGDLRQIIGCSILRLPSSPCTRPPRSTTRFRLWPSSGTRRHRHERRPDRPGTWPHPAPFASARDHLMTETRVAGNLTNSVIARTPS